MANKTIKDFYNPKYADECSMDIENLLGSIEKAGLKIELIKNDIEVSGGVE